MYSLVLEIAIRWKEKSAKVLERNKVRFVGTVQMHKNFAFVVPTDARMYTDFFVLKDKLNGAQDGDRVIVRIEDWKTKAISPMGGSGTDTR